MANLRAQFAAINLIPDLEAKRVATGELVLAMIGEIERLTTEVQALRTRANTSVADDVPDADTPPANDMRRRRGMRR